MSGVPLVFRNLQVWPTDSMPTVGMDEFRAAIRDLVQAGNRLAAYYGEPMPDDAVRLIALLADDRTGDCRAVATEPGGAFPALTPDIPQAGGFEREIAEQWGVTPTGHPWLKPLRFHRSKRPGHDAWARTNQTPLLPSVMDFFRVDGPGIHEVAVGPVHAGIIEPGHFRFQCHGEHVLHLEISLGYQHRGVEPALLGGPNPRTIHYLETLAGDTTIGHTLAYCQAIEALAGCHVPPRAQALRAIALELERLANHTGDLGAMAGDVGYLPTSSFCGRLRGDFLNLSALLCGSRFGRALVRPGGTAFDLNATRVAKLQQRLAAIFRDVTGAVELLLESPSVLARFENTGPVPLALAEELGMVGPAARASGCPRDARRDFPSGPYAQAPMPVATAETGDVLARATVRWEEIQHSVRFILEQLTTLPSGPVRVNCGALAPTSRVVSIHEGWRGEIVQVATTDAHGHFASYKIVDPSFHNWMGLALALRGQEISDFPLCNKSFNLSYCGHDL